MILSIDVGGTTIKYAYLTSPKIRNRQELPTEITSYKKLEQMIIDLISPYKTKIKAVTFSFPGVINDDGKLLTAGAIKSLDGIELKKKLEKKIKIPVFVENDAHCAALAELKSGKGRDVDDFILVTLGTGVGGSIVCNGKILKGKDFIAGELGMMLINRDKSNYERLHDNASTSALIREYNSYFNTEIEDARLILKNYNCDKEVTKIVDSWALNIAYGIVNLVTALNPQKVLIGGGISENEKLLPIIYKALGNIPFWEEFQCEIDVCQFRNNAGILGAYWYAIERMDA